MPRTEGRRATKTAPPQAMPLYQFSVAKYEQLVASGVLTENDRVELLDGWIVETMPREPPHSAALSILIRWLTAQLPTPWILRMQCPITLANSQPEPDLVIAAGPEERFWTTHPRPREIILVIEIADSSLKIDCEVKGPIYAEAGVLEYWIVNLVDRRVEVYSRPRKGRSPGYRGCRDYSEGEAVPLVIESNPLGELPVSSLMPPT